MQKNLNTMLNGIHSILAEICPDPLSSPGIHGVLTAVALSPIPSVPSTWTPVLYNMKNEQPEFRSREQAKSFLDSSILAYNAVVAAFTGKEESFDFPFPSDHRDKLNEGETTMLRDWCEGFIKGLRSTGVDVGQFDHDFVTLMSPIAFCVRPDFFKQEQENNDFSAMVARIAGEMPQNMAALRNYFFIHMQKEKLKQNFRATAGRNDPCPCGSGKKYKHCCGKAVQ